MNVELEKEIRGEIFRRAVERSRFEQQEREKLLYTRDMIDALQEVTDLSRAELDKIVEEVRNSYVQHGEGFLSIKYQIFFVSIFMLIFLGIPILGVWLF